MLTNATLANLTETSFSIPMGFDNIDHIRHSYTATEVNLYLCYSDYRSDIFTDTIFSFALISQLIEMVVKLAVPMLLSEYLCCDNCKENMLKSGSLVDHDDHNCDYEEDDDDSCSHLAGKDEKKWHLHGGVTKLTDTNAKTCGARARNWNIKYDLRNTVKESIDTRTGAWVDHNISEEARKAHDPLLLYKVVDELRKGPFEVFEDYSELCIQLGFLTVFGAAWPMMGMVFFAKNWLEMRSDLFKMRFHTHAITPRRQTGIGPWESIFKFVIGAGFLMNFVTVFVAMGKTFSFTDNLLSLLDSSPQMSIAFLCTFALQNATIIFADIYNICAAKMTLDVQQKQTRQERTLRRRMHKAMKEEHAKKRGDVGHAIEAAKAMSRVMSQSTV